MILKLGTTTHSRTCNWIMMDKVSRIRWNFVDKTPELKKHAERACMMWIDSYPIDADSKSPLARRKMMVVVHVNFENGKYDILYTDDLVYVLNNEGKTIDTINT